MRIARTLRTLLVTTALGSLLGCEDCEGPLTQLPDPQNQIDIFAQETSARVDILWVMDNSESMAEEQAKVSNGFAEFFGTLLGSRVDYHIGVVTTDPDSTGILRRYDGPDVTGCEECRFLTKDVGCDDPTVDVSGMSDAEAEAALYESCHAQLVFRNLISAGIDGSPFEEGFRQAAMSLGLGVIDPETGLPTGEVPEENAGFLRDDASLFIVFVSDEDEGAKEDGTPIRYYQRLFESLKGRGNELNVSVSAIVGWPKDETYPTVREVCPILETTFDNNTGTNDPRASTVLDALTTGTGCVDRPVDDEPPATRAETGSRYIELACRTGGVVTNLCDEEYTSSLDTLGANAAGLSRRFILSKFRDIESGEDCELFTADDFRFDCNEDGDTEDTIDGPICVKGIPFGSTSGQIFLVPRSEVGGWTYDPETGALNFRGAFLPAPNTELEVMYRLKDPTSPVVCDD